jgi:sugar/nucleoside kinase (ribokinase family)
MKSRGPVVNTPRLICIGNITVDESVQPNGTRREALGGDAIFAVLAARYAGGDAGWLAPFGNDLPETLVAELCAAGLDTAGLPDRDLPSVRNVVTYHAAGGRTWDLVAGDDHFDQMSVYPADVPDRYLACDGLLVLAMSVRSQLALTPWLRANSAAAIYLDLEEDGVVGHEAELLDIVASCDVFLPSEVEARRLSGSDDMEVAARRFSRLGPSCVVIKRAERGCLVLENGVLTEVATTPVVALDPTGAGDAFCGAFAAAHLEFGDAVAAARIAAGAARVAIGGYGVEALLAEAKRAEAERRLAIGVRP